MTFPNLPCTEVHLDAMDVAGDNQLDISDSFQKQRLDKKGVMIMEPVKEVLNQVDPKEVRRERGEREGEANDAIRK